MNERMWTADDRDEFESMCNEAWDSGEATRDRIDAFLSMLRDAIQSHRPWAFEVEDEALRRGANALLNRWNKRSNQVAVSYRGKVISKPRVIGARRTDEAGNAYSTQSLFDFMSWDELRQKKNEYLVQLGAYTANVALIDRLLALYELAPSATNAADAATSIGTTVEAWIGQDAA